MITFIPKKIH